MFIGFGSFEWCVLHFYPSDGFAGLVFSSSSSSSLLLNGYMSTYVSSFGAFFFLYLCFVFFIFCEFFFVASLVECLILTYECEPYKTFGIVFPLFHWRLPLVFFFFTSFFFAFACCISVRKLLSGIFSHTYTGKIPAETFSFGYMVYIHLSFYIFCRTFDYFFIRVPLFLFSLFSSLLVLLCWLWIYQGISEFDSTIFSIDADDNGYVYMSATLSFFFFSSAFFIMSLGEWVFVRVFPKCSKCCKRWWQNVHLNALFEPYNAIPILIPTHFHIPLNFGMAYGASIYQKKKIRTNKVSSPNKIYFCKINKKQQKSNKKKSTKKNTSVQPLYK